MRMPLPRFSSLLTYINDQPIILIAIFDISFKLEMRAWHGKSWKR